MSIIVADNPDMELVKILDGFGWIIGTVTGGDAKKAIVVTPIAPNGEYSYSFIMSKEMAESVIEKLTEVLPLCTYTSADVQKWLEEKFDNMSNESEESIH